MKCNTTGFLTGVLLFLLVVITYLPVWDCGYIWDDSSYPQRAAQLNTAEGLQRIWFAPTTTDQYYPLVHSSYWLEYKIWGDDPTGYHVVNVLLHALVAIFLWQLLKLLGIKAAWTIAAIFALHPVHVESVAWITERKNVLSGCLYMLSAIFYFKWAFNKSNKSSTHYVVALFLFVLAMFSKTVVCSLPAAILLVLFWKNKKLTKPDWLALAPFFVIGLGMGLLTASLEKNHAGAQGSYFEISTIERFLVAGRGPFFYFSKLLWPTDLAFFYPRWQMDDRVLWQYLFPIALLTIIFLLWKFKEKIGYGPLVCLLFFVGTLFPALGFIDVIPFRYSYVADHFQYLASIGMLVLIAHFALNTFDKYFIKHHIKQGILWTTLLTLSVLSWQQQARYKDMESLWNETLKIYPHWAARMNLGLIYQSRGELNKAIECFKATIKNYELVPEAHMNLGNALKSQRKFKEALFHFNEALRLRPTHHKEILYTTKSNIGTTYAMMGDFSKALECFKEALKANPRFAKAHSNITNIYLISGDLDKALFHAQTAVEIEPSNVKAQLALANCYFRQNNREAASKQYQKVVKMTQRLNLKQKALKQLKLLQKP